MTISIYRSIHRAGWGYNYAACVCESGSDSCAGPESQSWAAGADCCEQIWHQYRWRATVSGYACSDGRGWPDFAFHPIRATRLFGRRVLRFRCLTRQWWLILRRFLPILRVHRSWANGAYWLRP